MQTGGMSLPTLLEALGGVARTRELRDRGASDARIAHAVRDGRVERPRRGWLALPDADPDLVAAAAHGVVLTCITEAQRLGLWTLSDGRTHVAASSAARPSVRGCTVHWGRPLQLRPPGTLADPVVNVLQFVADCQPFEEALVVWNSALNRGLVDRSALSRLPLRGTARRLLTAAKPFFDSGLETLVASRLRWTKIRLLPQAHLFGHRVDLLIGERLVLQIDGASHTGRQWNADNAFDALLVARGYTVIRIGYLQIVEDWHSVQSQLLECIAQGLHLARR
ncbi:Very-short-patch-repair endonuclease [Leucobacter chromiiresistens]|uniref:Very-short-patch-repair endonuclease n=2 Tax=Leucobacter chromiiresistens TaxID=1079994 RepID=A0A1H0ZFI5_9MICO|nr:Very-short-patch-repair endonuclease [Leucobacter chromiiresistens]